MLGLCQSDHPPMTSPLTDDERTTTIRALNDAFRATVTGLLGPWLLIGDLVVTSGIASRGNDFLNRAVRAVHDFADFTPDNDPYGEHDFGAFDLNGERLNWKIDYYDAAREFGSDDPADRSMTRRVLTILLAEEY